MRNLVKIVKVYKRYKIWDIQVWDSLQLSYARQPTFWKSQSLHYQVLRIDPKWTWNIIWKWMCEQRGLEDMFNVDAIERNYTLHPIIAWNDKYMNKKTAKKLLYFDVKTYEEQHWRNR